MTNNLHGIHWESGDYLYLSLNQIIQSFVLRKYNDICYAKGKEKADLLAKYLEQKVVNLGSFVSEISATIKEERGYFTLSYHCETFPEQKVILINKFGS